MTTLNSSRLKAVLDRARNAGNSEESATIAGLPLVFSSMPPSAYSAIMAAVQEVEDEVEYMASYQIEHVCRSIVEIDGTDLRGIQFIEVEDEDASGQLKTYKVERHEWVKDNIVSTWSREMILVAFRKVMDVIALAENKANRGVEFRASSETDEDKYHRLLAELEEVGANLPDDMLEAILKTHGLLKATSQEELDALNEAAKQWVQSGFEKVREEEAPVEPIQAAPAPQPVERSTQQSSVKAPRQLVEAYEEEAELSAPAPASLAEGPRPRPKTPREMLKSRQPMNRIPIQPPVPESEEYYPAPVANPRPPPPPADQVASASALSSRAAEFAALEKQAAAQGIPLDIDPNAAYNLNKSESPIIEERLNTALDQKTLVVDPSPPVGINRKYSPPGGLDPRNR